MKPAINLTGITGKSILITGHTGFKGTWLTLLLESLGFEVFGVSLPPEPTSLFQKMERLGQIEEAFIDICEIESLYEYVNKRKPAVILHLAAQPLVKVAYEDPASTFNTNVIGTANVLEISRRLPSVKAVGVVTTDKVYKNNNSGVRFKESDELGGNEPYSASKVAAEAAVVAWRSVLEADSAYKLMTFRSGNVIGGGDLSEARIIPDLVRNIYDQQPLILRNLEATRPWQHVLDPLVGYLKAIDFALTNENHEDCFNFGPDEPSLKVGQLAEIFMKASGKNDLLESQTLVTEFHESISLDLDSSLAKKVLDWKPVWSQEEAIRRTAQWWSKIYVDGVDSTKATIDDISSYLSSPLLK